MLRTILTTGLACSVLIACGEEQKGAENVVEIYLSDILDNVQNGYCLDIAKAQGTKANPDDGLQGHTCYSPSGEIGFDQAFDPDKIADGVLYMPNFDVCVDIPSTEAGASIALAACNGGGSQAIEFSGEGTITPASATGMCLTLAEATRTGRSEKNQIKVLSLEPCDEAKAAHQSWTTRKSAE